MLTTKEAILARRSIRSFRGEPVPDELVTELLEAARQAPSGGNRQPWRFMVVKDPETKKAICEISQRQKFIEEAPLVIVCFADLDAYAGEAVRRRRQEFVDFGVVETLSGAVAERYRTGVVQAEPDRPGPGVLTSALANTYIAVEHIALMATALGLGTCWVGASAAGGRLQTLLGTPDHLVPVVVLPVGYPEKVPGPRPRIPLVEMVIPAPGHPPR